MFEVRPTLLHVAAAADSLEKASTPDPIGKPGGPGLWHHKGMELPPYVQHIAKALMKSGHPESEAIAIAVSSMKKWEADPHADAGTKAASAKGLGDWARDRAQAHASSGAKDAAKA
jgi:hypothetical protein